MALDANAEGEELVRLLLRRKRIGERELQAARHQAALLGGRLSTALYRVGAVDLPTLAAALGEVHEMTAAGPERFRSLEKAHLEALPARIAVRALAVPVGASEVAFAAPGGPASRKAVAEALGREPRARVAPEPLIYLALVTGYGLARLPRHLSDLVEEIKADQAALTRKRAAGAPAEPPDHFVTTPMAGALPASPDDISTEALGGGVVLTPEEVLAEPSDPLGVAQLALAGSSDPGAAGAAVLGYAQALSLDAILLSRQGGELRSAGGVGAWASRALAVEAARPGVLRAALSGDSGYLGAIPANSANEALLAGLGRRPPEVLIVSLCRSEGKELLLLVEGGGAGFDPALVERFTDLARRARQALE